MAKPIGSHLTIQNATACGAAMKPPIVRAVAANSATGFGHLSECALAPQWMLQARFVPARFMAAVCRTPSGVPVRSAG